MGTTLAIVALLLAAIALGYAWLLRQDVARATRRLDRYNRALYQANDEIRQLREEHADRLVQLQAALARSTGSAEFHADMTVRELEALHPQAQQILSSYHMGGCSSCAIDPDDRLDRLCQANGIPITDVLANLNALLTQGTQAPITPQRVKVPNIELSL